MLDFSSPGYDPGVDFSSFKGYLKDKEHHIYGFYCECPFEVTFDVFDIYLWVESSDDSEYADYNICLEYLHFWEALGLVQNADDYINPTIFRIVD